MIPEYFETIVGNVKGYWDSQFPEATDCINLDQQIGKLNEFISSITKRDLEKRNEALPWDRNVRCSDPNSSVCSVLYKYRSGKYIGPIYGIAAQLSLIKIKIQLDAITARKDSINYLKELLRRKQEVSITLDCRNQIETKRQEESAQLFSNTSKTAEERILGESKKKQYIYLGIGSGVLLLAIYLLLKD